jgi:hypothetical protein
MSNSTLRPMRIRQFLLCWITSSLLLFPIVIVPTLILIVLIDPQFSTADLTVSRLSYIYSYMAWWEGNYINDLLMAVFSVAIAFAQTWMFQHFLYIRVHYWLWLTIIGGGIGALLMGLLESPMPLEMTPWFLCLSLAQWWTIRKMVKYGWLWVLAHVGVSFFFPAYGNSTFMVLLHWTYATLIYAGATLIVLYQLAQNARIDKLKQPTT